MLYELLVYRRAFDADTQTAVLLKILNEAPPTLLSLDSGLDPALVEIVERTLAKDPAERPPDLGSLRSELTRLLYRLESISPDDRTMIVPRPYPRTGAPVRPARRSAPRRERRRRRGDLHRRWRRSCARHAPGLRPAR